MNIPYIGNSYYDYSDPVTLAACYLFLDAIVRPFSEQATGELWKPKTTNLNRSLIKPGVTAMVVRDTWLPEIAMHLSTLAESDRIPHIANPCDEEMAQFMDSLPRAMPPRISEFTPAVLDLMGQLQAIAPPVAPQPWVASPLVILTFDPERNRHTLGADMFPAAWLKALHTLKQGGASVMILCNDWGALPNRVLSAIDRRCVIDGLRVGSWIFREVISHSVYDGGAVPLNPWSEVDRAVSPLWLSDHIAALRWQ